MIGCVNVFVQGVRKVVVHIICLFIHFITPQFYGCLTWSSFPLAANATLRQYNQMVFSARTFQHQCLAEKNTKGAIMNVLRTKIQNYFYL